MILASVFTNLVFGVLSGFFLIVGISISQKQMYMAMARAIT